MTSPDEDVKPVIDTPISAESHEEEDEKPPSDDASGPPNGDGNGTASVDIARPLTDSLEPPAKKLRPSEDLDVRFLISSKVSLIRCCVHTTLAKIVPIVNRKRER